MASTLGDGLTPFFIDRGAHPRLPLLAPAVKGSEPPGLYSRRMRDLELTVRELLSAAQQERKAKLDAGRVDTVFQVGDQVLLRTKYLLHPATPRGGDQAVFPTPQGRLLPQSHQGGRARTKELLDAADIGKLWLLWDGPFTVMACPSPNAYTLALQLRMLCSPTVNVDRLKPFHARVDAPPAAGPVSDPGQEGEHEVELLLNRKTKQGVTRYLETRS